MVMKFSVYGKEGCPWTEKAIGWFTAKGIRKVSFNDVVKDYKARDEMVKKSGQLTTPVIDIDGEIIVGYDRTKMERALLR